ncbi:hypothetical protein K435DRAFT_789287 [Dendrothele bispora CBS 962.96]|uniref:Uncharacterized protein n=1 Tax=Dendrothele bispora (strain CBS 962.96) TaxID=1314807 RepID=A0A4S8MVI3_DENBC|nr:hypothetical protein K435DRAFT_789287 [Dendrothele bispora CBS 962.96]
MRKQCALRFLTYPATGSTDSEDRATLIKTKSGPRRVPPLVFKSVSKAGQPGANAAVSDLDIKKTGFWAGSADRIVTRLENGDGVLYSQVHVKASHPELELTHIPLGDNRVNTLMKSLSVSSRWGWLVPSEIEGVIFENVIYPPKFFRRELKRDKQIYIPWKDHETAPDKPADAFCVLVYKLNAKMLHHYKAYVAFGHRHDKAKIFIWTDITVHGPSTSKEEIISGTFVKERKMTDSNTKTSAVYDFRAKGEGQDLSVLNVTVEERLGLERGTHLLRLGWGKENPKDCPQEKHQ